MFGNFSASCVVMQMYVDLRQLGQSLAVLAGVHRSVAGDSQVRQPSRLARWRSDCIPAWVRRNLFARC
jgi:hypothetical protein